MGHPNHNINPGKISISFVLSLSISMSGFGIPTIRTLLLHFFDGEQEFHNGQYRCLTYLYLSHKETPLT